MRSSVVSSGRGGNSESDCVVDESGMPTDMVRSKGNVQLSASDSARCGEILTFDMMMPGA